jgi:hypothetical protein
LIYGFPYISVEAFGTDPIKHALRVTVRATNGYVYPASHSAGSRAGALPMGARLRLKANVNISTYPAHLQRIFQAMKTYGLIVADNGSDMYVSGSSDPRWDSQMDTIVPAFSTLNASLFDVIQLGWQPTGVPPGYPPGVPALTRYFAEGSNNTFFETTIDLMNPGTQNANVLLRFLKSDGTVVPFPVSVPAQRHVTVVTTAVDGLQNADFSTAVETDQLVVAERTMVWTPSERYGSHSETAAKAPATQWFLAEGATHGIFSLFYLLANPSDAAANVEITYLLPGGQEPIVLDYPVAPHSRRTIPVNNEPGLSATDVSAAIRSTNGVPIIVERAMYFSKPGQPFAGGHDSAGVPQPANHWFFAEGASCLN